MLQSETTYCQLLTYVRFCNVFYELNGHNVTKQLQPTIDQQHFNNEIPSANIQQTISLKIWTDGARTMAKGSKVYRRLQDKIRVICPEHIALFILKNESWSMQSFNDSCNHDELFKTKDTKIQTVLFTLLGNHATYSGLLLYFEGR